MKLPRRRAATAIALVAVCVAVASGFSRTCQGLVASGFSGTCQGLVASGFSRTCQGLVASGFSRTSERLSGVVSRVRDGDSLDISANNTIYKVRLQGIDAPELDQPFGREARVQLRVLAFSRSVTAIVSDRDRYGRLVARVLVGATDVGEEMIRTGFAWHYARYDADPRLAALEQQARQQRRGLWAEAKPVAPWEWRSAHVRLKPDATYGTNPSVGLKPDATYGTNPSVGLKPDAPYERPRSSAAVPGPYHGNTASLVYHAAGCKDYDCKHCTAAFMSRAAAEAAGYRPHQGCVKGK